MPIYEFECRDCGHITEILVARNETNLAACENCGSGNLKQLLSAHAAINPGKRFPENPSDRCCGVDGPPTPCEGPGSCCGKSG